MIENLSDPFSLYQKLAVRNVAIESCSAQPPEPEERLGGLATGGIGSSISGGLATGGVGRRGGRGLTQPGR